MQDTEIVDIAEGAWQGKSRAAFADEILSALIDPDSHGEAIAPEGTGRGAVHRVELSDGRYAIVRQFRRGGFISNFLRDSYVLDNRPLKEWNVSLEIEARGLPIAQPIAVVWRKDGILFRGRIATLEVEGESLAALKMNLPKSEVLESIGETIARFHDHGVYHADLNTGNILIADTGPVIIDWDKGAAQCTLDFAKAEANLARFKRSLKKLGFSPSTFNAIQRGYWGGFKRTEMRGSIASSLSGQDIPDLFSLEGETIKASSKADSLRTDHGYLKRTPKTVLGYFRSMIHTERFRANLYGALRLQRGGISIAKPIAYAERKRLGYTTQQAMLTEWLDDYVNVEAYARDYLDDSDAVHSFLERLAESVRVLAEKGINHADLSGKNIFTRDGQSFTFIDIDSVQPSYGVDRDALLKRDIQLYDSFCDLWGDEYLEPFLRTLHRGDFPEKHWFGEVQHGQAERRARTVAKWEREGRALDHSSENG